MGNLQPKYLVVPGLKLRFRRPAWPFTALIVLALICLVSLLDYLAGSEPEFSIFYLVPITAAVFLSGRAAGIIASLASAAAWLLADLLSGAGRRGWLVLAWDDVVQLGFFMLHTFLISWLLTTIAEVRALSLRDPLTGAANWRYFEEFADAQLRLAQRDRRPVTFAYIDLDNFKRLNDRLGHHTGNKALQTVAAAIQSQIRPTDLLARLGGDEFGLLLSDSPDEDVRAVLERVVAEARQRIAGTEWELTLSVGAITYRQPPASIASMVKEADALMYRVKNAQKNAILYEERP